MPLHRGKGSLVCDRCAGGAVVGRSTRRGQFEVCLVPKFTSDADRFNVLVGPTKQVRSLTGAALEVDPAKRDGEFVAHFATEYAGLGKAKIVRIRRLAATHEAGLRSALACVS